MALCVCTCTHTHTHTHTHNGGGPGKHNREPKQRGPPHRLFCVGLSPTTFTLILPDTNTVLLFYKWRHLVLTGTMVDLLEAEKILEVW